MMKKLFLACLVTQNCEYILAQNLRACATQNDCNQDEICVSYTNCQGRQIKRCLARTCYRSGVGCPSEIVCNEKHCSVLNCK